MRFNNNYKLFKYFAELRIQFELLLPRLLVSQYRSRHRQIFLAILVHFQEESELFLAKPMKQVVAPFRPPKPDLENVCVLLVLHRFSAKYL